MGDIRSDLPNVAADKLLSLESVGGVTSAKKKVETSGASGNRETALGLSNEKVFAKSLNIENTPPQNTSNPLTHLLRRNPSTGDVEEIDASGAGGGGTNLIPQNINEGSANDTFLFDANTPSGQEFEFRYTNNSTVDLRFDRVVDGWWAIISVTDGNIAFTALSGETFVNGNFDGAASGYEENVTLFLTFNENSNRMRIVRWV